MCQKATPIFKISNLRSSFRRNNLLANVLGQLFPSDISSRRQSVCFHQICISQVDQPDLHLLHQRLDPPRPRLVVLRLGLSLHPTDRSHQRSENLLRHPLCLHFLRPYSHFCQKERLKSSPKFVVPHFAFSSGLEYRLHRRLRYRREKLVPMRLWLRRPYHIRGSTFRNKIQKQKIPKMFEILFRFRSADVCCKVLDSKH